MLEATISQQELLSCPFFDHLPSHISKLLLLCDRCVPFHQLVSPMGFHVTYIPKGNLVQCTNQNKIKQTA